LREGHNFTVRLKMNKHVRMGLELAGGI
jgi:hypothetical protein